MKIISRSDRFFAVEINDNYNVHIGGEVYMKARERDINVNTSGTVYLKKLSDDKWITYLYIPKNGSYDLLESIVRGVEQKLLSKDL